MAKAKNAVQGADLDNDELVALARLDVERGDLEKALVKLKQALTVDNPPAEALAMTARLYAQLHLFPRAAELFRRCLELNPQAETERFQYGMVQFDSGEVDKALDSWEEVLRTDPIHPPSLFYKSLGLVQLGRAGEARNVLDILLKSARSDNLYFSRAKDMLQMLDSGRHNEIDRLKAGNGGSPEIKGVMPREMYKTEH